MIKNYNILREFEHKMQQTVKKKTVADSLIAMNDMLEFAGNFQRERNCLPENTPHVKMLINMTLLFKKYKEQEQNDISRKISS